MIDYLQAAREAASATEMPEGYRLVPITEDDLMEVVAVEKCVFPQEAWSAAMLADELNGPFRIYVGVFDHTDTMVGYAGSMYSPDSAEIMTIGVVPEARGKGLGKAMTAALVSAARVLQVDSIFLECRDSNAVARSLYEELGFAEIDRRARYYHNPTEDAVIMRLILE
ncbi:ribosomal protein S18-alanine N-acetyltransferase [Actinomycetaceae bacterium TAE3-ERU4]|nr:ribosomal protein S18-alanine N-acetyltransferase [Actinomycetaceae bacterium TAE3-ERU4]